MKKLLWIAAAVTGAFIHTGCGKDDGTPPDVEFGDPVEVLLSVEKPATRGLDGTVEGVGRENEINSLEIYVYSSDGQTYDPNVGNGKGYVKFLNGNLTQRVRVSQGNGKQFLVVANSGTATDGIGEPADGETLASIKARITQKGFLQVPTPQDNPREIPENGFEMSGTATATVREGTTNQVPVTLYRTVSKIMAPTFPGDVPVEISQQEQIDRIWDPTEGFDTSTEITFQFSGFSVINGIDRSNIYFTGNVVGNYKDPENVKWDRWNMNGKARINSKFVETDGPTKGHYVKNYSGPSKKVAGSWFLTVEEAPVYINESKAEEKVTPGLTGYDANTVCSYIIEGKLTPDDDETKTATRYWRVDLTRDEAYHLMRNVAYKVQINKITTPGYGSPEEAEDPETPVPPPGETTTDFVVTIADWDLNYHETDM